VLILHKSETNPFDKYWILKEGCHLEKGKLTFTMRTLSTSEVRKTLGETFEKCEKFCSLRIDRYRYKGNQDEWFDISTIFGEAAQDSCYYAVCSSIHNQEGKVSAPSKILAFLSLHPSFEQTIRPVLPEIEKELVSKVIFFHTKKR
jgi:hypothetical protein